jgi:hypothetical protein
MSCADLGISFGDRQGNFASCTLTEINAGQIFSEQGQIKGKQAGPRRTA